MMILIARLLSCYRGIISWLKWIWALFAQGFKRNPSPVAFDSLKSQVKQVLTLDLSSAAAREEHGEFVLNVLRQLDAEIAHIRQAARGYPANPISALVWMNGAGYGNLSRALTDHFHHAGWLQREENASALWAKVTLAVCSHYHHMVGPAMLANADCHERLGNADLATKMYAGVVKDFVFIAEDWANEADSPPDEERLALNSLQTAVDRLLRRGIGDIDGMDLVAMQAKIDAILLRSQPQGQQESS